MAFERIDHSGAAVDTTLAGDITSNDTTLGLTAATNWPDGGVGGFYFIIDPGIAAEEKVLASSRSNTTITGLTRGVDGTTAQAHSAGAVIKHGYTAVEADEANNVAHQTLGQIGASGDLLVGNGTNSLIPIAVGSDSSFLMANSASQGGMTWSGVATNNINNGSITAAKLSPNFWHPTTFSVTASGGNMTIAHGASFTPTFVQIMFTHPFTVQSAGEIGGGFVVQSIDATNVQIRASFDNGTVSGSIMSWLV